MRLLGRRIAVRESVDSDTKAKKNYLDLTATSSSSTTGTVAFVSQSLEVLKGGATVKVGDIVHFGKERLEIVEGGKKFKIMDIDNVLAVSE